ncbi:MAG: two-component regulator propeller domain-containing protein [Saprospiraceae bacterium]
MRKFFTILWWLGATNLFSQTDLKIGQWKSHLPFQRGVYVTQSDDQVFYATQYAVLIIDKADRALERLTKVEGLSQVGVKQVKYNRGSHILAIVYDNSAIDLLYQDGSIASLPNIPASNIVIGEKTINEVYMANDSIAYLAANFGLITLNVVQGIFPNTVKTPVEVNGVAIFNDLIYIATPEGLYTTDPNAGYNIDDFANWDWVGGEKGFPQAYHSNAINVYNDHLYLDVNDSLYVFDGDTARYVNHQDTSSIEFITAEGEHLLVGFFCGFSCYGKTLIYDGTGLIGLAGGGCVVVPQYAIEDTEGNIWYADLDPGFKVEEKGTGFCQEIELNSPRTISSSDIETGNGQVWVAAGGIDQSDRALFNRNGFYSLIDGIWTTYNGESYPQLIELSDFIDIKINPTNGKIYTGAFLDGLVEFDPATREIEVYNETNSDGKLNFAVLDASRTRVLGLAFDQEGNLWMCNNNAPNPLVVLRSDGTWENYELPCTPDDGIYKILVDNLGYKWMAPFKKNNAGIIVFDEGDPGNPADDRCKVINTSNSVLPSNVVNALALDRDGAVWAATSNGAAVFQCDPLGGDCPGTLPFVEVDGFGANLLEEQNVLSVAVDGANRKWFGTQAGVFVMSPEGNTQIAHFTEENSPLFDDIINDIAFDGETGEAYIGTQNGLISYRSEATEGGSFHADALVFPNPVRSDYEGPIAIKGLAEDATVKITDVGGQLVYETKALGGQAIWNGRDYNDRKVNTGVYLVFATSRNSSNPDVVVAKVLVVN